MPAQKSVKECGFDLEKGEDKAKSLQKIYESWESRKYEKEAQSNSTLTVLGIS